MRSGTQSDSIQNPRILLIEDDVRLQRIIARVLEHEGWSIDLAADGATGLSRARAGGYDCLIVDRMLPGLEGLDVVRALRRDANLVPILVLTAKGDRPDRVFGLDAGADDYLGKPFAFEELIARVRALRRRAIAPSGRRTIEAGKLRLDLGTMSAAVEGAPVDLTVKEFAVLKALVHAAGRVLSRADILADAWEGEPEVLEETVDLYIHYLRRKLDRAGAAPSESMIRTIRGVGYALRSG
jgi:DNA-binding response OmpR family regulator